MPPDFDIVEKVLEEATELKDSSQADADAFYEPGCSVTIEHRCACPESEALRGRSVHLSVLYSAKT